MVYDQLLKAMHLDVPQAFRLQPGQDHELVWARRKREVADHLLDLAAEANVDLDEGSFHWPSPVERTDIQRTLVGLSILDQAVQRWIRAHHEVTTAHPDAVGLRQIKRVQILAEKRRFRRSGRKDEKQPEDQCLGDHKCDGQRVHRWLGTVVSGSLEGSGTSAPHSVQAGEAPMGYPQLRHRWR